jgi:hypothetical protein
VHSITQKNPAEPELHPGLLFSPGCYIGPREISLKRLPWVAFAFAIFLTLEVRAPAQNIDTESTSRADQIQTERLEKSKTLAAPPTPAPPKFFRLAQQFDRHVPLTFLVAGLGPGAGPGLSTALQSSRDSDRVLLTLWGNIFLHTFYTAGAGVELRSSSKHDLALALEGLHSDAPQLVYYGPGPNSSIHNETDFRREDTLFNLRAMLRERHRHLGQTCHISQLWLNVGPGTDESLPSTASVFGPAQAPGIQTQSNFLIAGCSGEVDWRDTPENSHKGTYVEANFNRYFAEGHDQFSFYRLSMIGEQYFPFFNRKRVIALRGLTALSFHSSNQVVPFYLQPTLGSDTELRGYARYRFYDENSVAFTAEYRWEINSAFDMALFGDAGNVFDRPGQISLANMKTSVGVGWRLKNLRNMAARLDVGVSREGVQVWFKFVKPF